MMKDGYKKGQTLIEVVAAIAVIMVAGTVLVSALTGALANNRLAKERMIATRLSQEGIEWLKQERQRAGSFSNFYTVLEGLDNGDDQLFICIGDFRIFILGNLPMVSPASYQNAGNSDCSSATLTPVANTNYIRELKMELVNDGTRDYIVITSKVSWESRNEAQEVVTTAEMYDYED